MSSTSKPVVLWISLQYLFLNHSTSAHLLSALQNSTFLLQAERVPTALAFLSFPNLKAVILGDAEVAEAQHVELRQRVVEFAKAGGTVILGCAFTSIRPSDLNQFFKTTWGLPWEYGTYQRAVFFLNPSRRPELKDQPLPESYSQRCVSLKGIARKNKVYIPTEESRMQIFDELCERVDDLDEAPVAFTKLKNGFLGYVGDVNSEIESTDVVLAMLGMT